MQPVTLELRLPEKYIKRPEFDTRERMFKQFGFSLQKANELPLDRALPDYRIQA
jgi:hypothetical protein